jgi:hypothetical protein
MKLCFAGYIMERDFASLSSPRQECVWREIGPDQSNGMFATSLPSQGLFISLTIGN